MKTICAVVVLLVVLTGCGVIAPEEVTPSMLAGLDDVARVAPTWAVRWQATRQATVQPVTPTVQPTATPQPTPAERVIRVLAGGSIAAANAQAAPGWTVSVAPGTYKERIIAKSGVTYQADPGTVLDGTGISVGGFQGLIDASGTTGVVVQGFTVRNSSGVGIFADRVQDLLVKANHTLHSNGSGIGIWNGRNVVADANDVEDSNFNGAQEALSFGGVVGYEIRYNKVHNPSATSTQRLKEGIDAKQGSSDGKIYGNQVYDLQKVALYVDAYDTPTANIEVYDNYLHDVRMGITLGAEHGGLLSGVYVHDNTIERSYYAGLRIFGQVDGYPDHPMANLRFEHNTVIGSGGGLSDSQTQLSGTNTITGNTFTRSGGIELASPAKWQVSGNTIN